MIDSADVSDAVGTIMAKSSNATLTNITNIAIILGLTLILSGLYALMRNVTLEGNGKALVQMGFFMSFVGLAGWILSGGMDFILGDAQTSDEIRGSVPVYYAGSRSRLRGWDRAWVWRLHLRTTFTTRDRGRHGGAIGAQWGRSAETDITRRGQRPRRGIQENRCKAGYGRRKELTALSKSVVRVHDNRTGDPSG
ncbi:MAG: hypothetical protein OXC71_03925 [Chloroflexi bacterium]|nr:hypothetical protein [Chloroflexota bacterium]